MGKYSTRDIEITVKFKGESRTFKNLHFEISVKKTLSAQPNSCDITIYNLNANSRLQFLKNARGSNKFIEVEVKMHDSLIYRGSLINSISSRDLDTGDYATFLYCGTNPVMFSHQLDTKVEAGATKASVIDTVATEMGKEIDGFKTTVKGFISSDCMQGKSILRSMTINGTIIDNFKKILKDCFPEKDFFIYPDDNGGITVLKGGDFLQGAEITIGENLIDPPELTEDGVNVLCLYENEAQLGGKMILKAENLSLSGSQLNLLKMTTAHLAGQGDYQIMEIVHTIDNYSSELASTKIVARSMEGTRSV